jgi:cyclic pyranopterin phosphate synthase
MPAEGIHKLHHREIMTYEELHRIARLAVSLGIEKIRITGGEPLVRKDLVGFLADLTAIDGLKELVLTTNGIFLRKLAPELRRAGVDRVNVSLDSLKPETFATITRGGHLAKVLDGIKAAEEAGFPPVKINVVVVRGTNDSELLDFAALTVRSPHQVRFIEYMPTSLAPDWSSAFVSGQEIFERISRVYSLEPLESTQSAGPARLCRIPGGRGTLGIITPISSHFCKSCNRVRVTAGGTIKGCLFDNSETDLKPYLQGSDSQLRAVLERVILSKPAGHHLCEPGADSCSESGAEPGSLITPFSMAQIGG